MGGSSGELGRVEGPEDDGDKEAEDAPDVSDTLEGRRSGHGRRQEVNQITGSQDVRV